ncbi:MAG: phosphoribosyltransferase [Nitrospiraceae bacterium]
MMKNREEAGRLLAERLRHYEDDPTALVLALPRGGVVVGAEIAKRLRVPLDVLITRKIGAPTNPEYALGAISETGSLLFNQEREAERLATSMQLEHIILQQRKEIERQQRLYRQDRPATPLANRTVILVDDGLATGATFMLSIQVVKAAHPQRLVAAIPVGPKESLGRIAGQVDELVVLQMPDPFRAVGEHYAEFGQVDDAEVIRCLRMTSGID